MKKKISVVILSVCALIAAVFTLVACEVRIEPEKSIIGNISQDDISMSVSATADSIVLDIDSDESVSGNAVVDIFEVKAYEYVSSDMLFGLSQSKVTSNNTDKKIGTYKLGTKATVTLDRFVETEGGDVDRLYNKYYIVSGKRLLKGPIYATDITAAHNAEPELDIKSKKGILGENVRYYDDLGCSYATINFNISDFIYPNEMFDEQGIIELAHPDDAVEFTSNGKKYYFNKKRVVEFDKTVKDYYSLGSHVTVIVGARNNGANPEVFPSELTYLPWSAHGGEGKGPAAILALNTSNAYGFGYFVAVMEFFASRYTKDDLENGYVANYIIGNEINLPAEYNRISKYQAPIDVYMEEYSRLLRLANLAVKKYDSSVTVNVPFTQAWSFKYDATDSTVHDYAPKDLVDWLNIKTKLEGDYDWGIAPHCYTFGLAQPYVFLNDTINGRASGMNADADTTSLLTFSNIELLDEYLSRPKMQCNGKTRGIWLTEQGVSTLNGSEEEYNVQAGSIAAIWYKLSQIDSIKSFSYYRMFDNVGEAAAGASFGLIDLNGEKKPSYELYKYIDTQYSQHVAKDYLRYNTFVDADGQLHTVDNGKIKSYMDLLDVFDTGWLKTEFDWGLATPVTAESVYEWDDKIDLSGVVFESKNYLYDGTQKSIEAQNLPVGVEVSYSPEPVLTDVGSKEIVATFTLDGEVVGRRKATIYVGQLATDKTVYNYGESIFVTADISKPELRRTAWIGIYSKEAVPGNTSSGDASYYYYYPNQYSDNYLRTARLQDYPNPDVKNPTLVAGDYVIYYFIDGGYDYFYSVPVKVLGKHESSGDVDLSDISFGDKTVEYDGSEQRLEIIGELPDGVAVEYVDNALTDAGTTQAVAVFKRGGIEICRRYAVFTVSSFGTELVSSDKTSYVEGEDIFVTAYAPVSSEFNTWWVGLYLADENDYATVGSIYYYYVKDEIHISGVAYNIKRQIVNSNRLEYAELPVGRYKLVLFNTSGYTVETECEFEIVEWDVSGIAGGISTDKTLFDTDESVLVTVTEAAAEFKFVVAVIKANAIVAIDNAIYSYNIDDDHEVGSAYDIKSETLNAALGCYAPLHAGRYKLVLFTVNKTTGVSKPKQVIDIQIGSDEQQPTAGTIYTNKTTYNTGDEVFVTAFAPEGSTSWWVGLYPKAQNDLSSPTSIRWYAVNEVTHVSGETYSIMKQLYTDFLYAELPEGEYKVVLFNSSDYDVETVCEFEVVGLNIDDESGSVTTDKSQYTVGEAIMVTAEQKADSELAYTVGILREGDAIRLNNVIYSYRVTDGVHSSGNAYDVTQEALNADMAKYGALVPARYVIALFVSNDNGGQNVIDSKTIEIINDENNPTRLFTNKTEYTVGEAIYVTAYVPVGTSTWWVGLYLADEDNYAATTSIWWYYINTDKAVSGEAYDVSRGDRGGRPDYEDIPAGSYRVVLFNTSGYTEETHIIINVSDAE